MPNFDTEYKRVLDKQFRKEDLKELQEKKDLDAIQGPLQPKDIEEFYAVTSSMNTALDDIPSLHFSQHITSSENYALRALYEAHTAKSAETGEFISGIERSRLLNQALMYLQPVLARALRPEFKEGRKIYDQLVSRLNRTRGEIKSAILMQIVPKRKKKKFKKTGQDNKGAPPVEATPAAETATEEAKAGATTEAKADAGTDAQAKAGAGAETGADQAAGPGESAIADNSARTPTS